MHPSPPNPQPKAPPTSQLDGGEAETTNADNIGVTVVTSNCTEVCGNGQFGRSCAKICLAKIYPQDAVDKVINAYVIIDDQSNRSLARPEFFNLYGIQTEPSCYQLRTCSGLAETSGRRADGFMIESIDGNVAVPLPSLIECSDIPNNRAEIPTPNAVIHQPHLRHIAKHLPELDPNAEILLLLGRDILRLHKIRQQVNGPHSAPFAQRLDLGWVIVGDVCLGSSHKPIISNFKTTVLENSRPSIFQPCTSYMQIKDSLSKLNVNAKVTEETLGKTVFDRTDKDNRPAPSIDDATFMEKMDKEMHQNSNNAWVAPLPFKKPRLCLPNNHEQAVKRFMSVEKDKQTLERFELIQPERDTDIRPEVKTYCTNVEENLFNSNRFQRFSTLKSLVRAVACLIHIARSFKQSNTGSQCKGWHWCKQPRSPEELDQAMTVILQAAQRSAFQKELSALSANKPTPKESCLQKLNPIFIDGLIRIGGRLKHSNLDTNERHPVALPKNSHVGLLLTRHHHIQVKHQGRHLTEGAIRAAGYWILGGKRLINTVIHNCVTCKKLRGKVEEQHMADLPPERLQACPPFTYVGLDVFGPWMVAARRTRGGHAKSKRWAIMFSCLTSRAVHIELIETMDASGCINALRRFFAIRGLAKKLISDCGTNFIAACKELGMDKNSQDPKIQRFLSENGCVWEFNPPHASHMGGSWERMIGVARRILDSMFLQLHVNLTHEALSTLIAEVAAIMNARPLVPVSTDPDDPQVFSPNMLLTQKSGVPPPYGDYSEKDMHTKQWKQVQALANQFWTRWRHEYLPYLQQRQKWTTHRKDLQVGDVVLLKDKQVERNHWPMGRINSTFPGKDGHVRQVEIKIFEQGTQKTFRRPITEVILLLPAQV